MENTIRHYNEFNTSNYLKVDDYISNKYDIIHEQLYNEALKNYLDKRYANEDDESISFEEYKKSFIINEIKNVEYYLPSSIIIKSIKPPYKVERVNLSPYWNYYEFKEVNKDFNNEFYIDDEDINNVKVICIDRVNGRIKLRNKITNKEFWKDIKYFSNDLNIDLDELSLHNTFSYKLQNKIYGK